MQKATIHVMLAIHQCSAVPTVGLGTFCSNSTFLQLFTYFSFSSTYTIMLVLIPHHIIIFIKNDLIVINTSKTDSETVSEHMV